MLEKSHQKLVNSLADELLENIKACSPSFFERLVPDGDPLFIHTAEGKDDMPAHIRTALTQTSLSIPISQGKVALGQWQGIFLYEHRYQSHERHILMHAIGE